MPTKIYAYNQGSQGARELATGLGVRVLRHQGSTYRPRAGDTVINWGASRLPNFGPARILNQPHLVQMVSNKLEYFRHTAPTEAEKEVGDIVPRVPDWTESKEEARGWIAEGSKVVCRTVLNGHSGAGIIIAEKPEELVDAPLYTKYVPKKGEYRLHFMKQRSQYIDREITVLIDTQRKARKLDEPNPNWAVRNLTGGFVYARSDLDCPADVVDQARRAFALSGLDFGAVDVIWNEKRGEAYVLEINTAPGISGTTVENYVNAFRNLL